MEDMEDIEPTRLWLKSVFNINRELDFEREKLQCSLERIEKLEQKKEELERINKTNGK